jgi:NAD(P)-dependent dehydrogenase (short-subunit alcohol dehydrogenase family)
MTNRQASFDFTGAHVFVFGGTSGINLGIAEAFARHGAHVCVASRKQENVDAAVKKLLAHGGKAAGYVADVRDFESVGRAFSQARENFGKIDILVSGAAGNFLAEVNGLSPNGFKVVIDIDLNGTFHVMRQAFPHLVEGASVINITAPQANVPMRYQAHVCAAKAGIDQLTRVLALEWSASRIRVNAISPGPIAHTGGEARLSPKDTNDILSPEDAIPLGRLGTVQDIAELAMFLSSDSASYITGAIIPCDGASVVEFIKPTVEAAGREFGTSAPRK